MNRSVLPLITAFVLMHFHATAQTINIGPDQYAFRFTLDPNFGMFFNATDSRYELRDGTAQPVFFVNALNGNTFVKGKLSVNLDNPVVDFTVFDARSNFGTFSGYAEFDNDGDLFFTGTADYLVGGDRYAFRFKDNENYGLFFNATAVQYEFRTSDATSIMSIGANNGDVAITGEATISGDAVIAGNVIADTLFGDASGLTNLPGDNDWTVGLNEMFNSNVSANVSIGSVTSNTFASLRVTDNGTEQVAVKGEGVFGPTNGYLGVQGQIDFDGEDSLDISGQEIGVLGISTGGSNTDNVGVYGFSNDEGGRFENEVSKNLAVLGGKDFAGDFVGNVRVAGESRLNDRLAVGIPLTNPLSVPLHVWEDGTTGPTITAVFTAPVSNRPVIQFSEGGNTDISSGFSLEYDGSGSGSENKFNINRIGGIPALTIRNNGIVSIPGGTDASLTSNGFLMLGSETSANVILDDNEIMARNNGKPAHLGMAVDSGTSIRMGTLQGLTDNPKLLVDGDGSNTAVRFRDGTSTKFMIAGDGRIFMNAPFGASGYAVSINGKMICEEIKVQDSGNWPDYVFDKDYDLKSIDEVERFIHENNHLPGIPSASEVEKEGISLGEMQKRMMEKIEELTLYVIQLKKENEELRERMNY